MTHSLTRQQWARVLEETEPATYGELVATLEERELVPGEPAALVDDAIEAGPLTEADASGSFTVYELAPAAVDEAPLEQYEQKGYVTNPDGSVDRRTTALDAAVSFTASARGPPFDTSIDDAGEWWDPAYNAACLALEDAIVDALTGEEPDGSADVDATPTPETGDADARDAFDAAIEFFHAQLNREVDLPHADVDTPREYFREVRGWTDATIDAKRLGWAPAGRMTLLDHLMSEGFDREAILGTGLFWENGLAPIWQGRLVFPYLVDDQAVFAISRRVGADGHPADDAGDYGDGPAKYHKIPGQDCARVDEPIYGADSLEDGDDVLITEGIADAITAHEAGYACLSPVTTTFKHADRERLLDILDERDVGTVYVVQDNEPPSADRTDGAEGWDALNIEQVGEGLRGAVNTAGFLSEHGVDVRLGELPRLGGEKVDLDDYLQGWAETLAPILAGAKPAEQHPAYEPAELSHEAAERTRDDAERSSDGDESALFELDILDVTGLQADYRGPNPLGHHGGEQPYSENYFVFYERNGTLFARDHKYKTTYTPLSYLLADAGVRSADRPNGQLNDEEMFEAWLHAKRENHVASDDPIPRRGLCHVAVDHGLCEPEEIEDGWRLPRRAYNNALDIIEDEYGADPGRDPLSGARTDAESAPAELKALDVTLDKGVAWRAARAVTPDELDTPADVPTTADGTGWCCPRCEAEIGVVRAAAIDATITPDCATPLQDGAYDRAYEHARRGLGAPLPEYVSRETATERWDLVKGAIRQLDYWHLDEDALESEITGRGEDANSNAELTLNPAWRDSDSGESVLVFPSGTVYEAHPDHDRKLDVLRFVGLDAGVIDWEEFTGDDYQLAGTTFREVYNTARDYGAPLPRWEGTDAYHTAVLPPADELVDDDVGDDDRLAAAYDAVADLYSEAAETEEATLLNVLPGLGKTEQVFRHAPEYPALYTAGRKELMADAVARADENGATSFILPVFAENGPPTVVKETTEAVVRKHGQRLLRDRWSLVDHVEARLPDDEELRAPDEYDSVDEDEIVLDRASCPTADGEYGLDWWLAVHVARARGYRPQQIHENAPALFGADLPCTCADGEPDGEATCPYTEAWETATDPEAPVDVLVGHYTHAHVEGARAYAVRENGRIRKRPRVVAVDEFPGKAYQREFDEEFPDLAAWLASALRDDVDDRQDLLTQADDLWSDETVRAWLDPDATSDEHARIATALGSAQAGLDAVSTAEWLLEDRRTACQDLGVQEALERLGDAHPTFDADTVATVTATLESVLRDDATRGAHTATLAELEDLIDHLQQLQPADATLEGDLDAALADASHVDGPLASLVATAVDGYRDQEESARARLDAAQTALQGGPDGCEALAMHADDGYAHPLAHALLYGLLAPEEADDVATVRTSNFTFGRDEDTRLDSVGYRTTRVLVDRNHHGAVVNHPPAFTAGGGTNPTVGLDATGRAALWELTLGREVTPRDIHETASERRTFLREVYGLQVVQTSPHANSYEGDPSGKNFDDDVELVREARQQYADAVGQDPAVLTTKVVEETLDDRLEGLVSATDHYGNLKGSNALADHRLAVLLGCQHYGDHVVERWAALGGEEAHRTGYGMALDYNSRVANTALQHMREDQVMQAALRFGRDSDGALVFAHTAAVRDDLPVVADGEVVRTFSKQAQAIAQAAGELARRPRFTAADVRERVDGHDPKPRTVRRVLGELAEFGYLEKTETANGLANEFSVDAEPRAAEVELPDVETRAAEDGPGRDPCSVYYTWFVRVDPVAPRPAAHRTVGRAQLPAPGGDRVAVEGDPPPG